ncbi:MAG: zinc ABC transporter substrate-binding protein [Thermovibrio sp.]|nr:MAG: zinc ABC transporter substrate-binding protein [Thermovibrio sp.]
MLRLLLILLISLLTFGCISENSNKPLIVTSLPIWKSVAEYIGGRDFRYYSILKGGESPHGYEPKPSDIERGKEASLIIVHGLGLDDWALKGVNDKKKVLNLGELFSKKYPQVKKPAYHLWMNPVLMEDVYFEVAERLVGFYPKRETYYKKRADDYAEMIEQLLGRISECLKGRKENAVVIFHPVWKPLLKTLGINVIEIARNPEEQVTPGRIKEVIEEAKRKGAKVVISESFANQKIPKLIAREIGGRVLVLNPIPSEDYVRALSEWGSKICRALKE